MKKLSESSEKLGITWWNGLQPWERLAMFDRAKDYTGRDCSPAEVWSLFDRGMIRMP